mmetsp:Transcript_33613/g.86079  ORF Transcript_33613/g.86079 Transcript_33613/m.86079 type:complete len:226 (-) Transcript_33613:1087-1764(-)
MDATVADMGYTLLRRGSPANLRRPSLHSIRLVASAPTRCATAVRRGAVTVSKLRTIEYTLLATPSFTCPLPCTADTARPKRVATTAPAERRADSCPCLTHPSIAAATAEMARFDRKPLDALSDTLPILCMAKSPAHSAYITPFASSFSPSVMITTGGGVTSPPPFPLLLVVDLDERRVSTLPPTPIMLLPTLILSRARPSTIGSISSSTASSTFSPPSSAITPAQ